MATVAAARVEADCESSTRVMTFGATLPTVRVRSNPSHRVAAVNRILIAVLRLFSRGRRGSAAAADSGRRVWRISDDKPEGEWVEADSRPPRAAEAEARSTLPMDSWATSSMDLRDGMQIVELDDPPPEHGPRPH